MCRTIVHCRKVAMLLHAVTGARVCEVVDEREMR